jgi:hypothetical protein
MWQDTNFLNTLLRPSAMKISNLAFQKISLSLTSENVNKTLNL